MTGERSLKSSLQADLDAFHSGFHACAKEVLQYLNKVANWTAREQMCTRLINHLHKVSAQFQLGAGILQRPLPGDDAPERDAQRDTQANCVPVIQRTQNLELNENDTDTDSGYGGEAEKGDGKCEKRCDTAKGVKIKQEFGRWTCHQKSQNELVRERRVRFHQYSAGRGVNELFNGNGGCWWTTDSLLHAVLLHKPICSSIVHAFVW